MDTIYALSSGQPPAAIAIVRVSGPGARGALAALAGRCPEPRRATLMDLTDGEELLDRALVLAFEAPNSVTGEDLVELHLHGGRAVVAAVTAALARLPGLRAAQPGEFTRRAFGNGRIDLTEAEGLADLLAAETESQRRLALNMAGGALTRQVQDWTQRLLQLAATIEAVLDFSDEGDVAEELPVSWESDRAGLEADMAAMLARPPAERLWDGVRVVIAGPPNSGKSTLLNAIAGREAAITSDIAGTTRDLIEVPLAVQGLPFLFIDSAGLRSSDDVIEAAGVDRARSAIATADIVLWLGEDEAAPVHPKLLKLSAKADLGGPRGNGSLAVSALTGAGLTELLEEIARIARGLLPVEGEVAANTRQRGALTDAVAHLRGAADELDLIIVAEELRLARLALDTVTGSAGVEDMLDTLFGRFCIGK
jgi:tRNA modification GTPase